MAIEITSQSLIEMRVDDLPSDDREVVKCNVCGLVQYQTRTGNCRRCLRLLPSRISFAIPMSPPENPPASSRISRIIFERLPNFEVVEHIGGRVKQLRESRGITQGELQGLSQVSRSYLSRVESGQMTPSLGSLEKIADALGVGLNRLFVREILGEIILEDPFIQELTPFLRRLDRNQCESILQRLRMMSENAPIRPRPLLRPQQRPRKPRGSDRRFSSVLRRLQAELKEDA